VRSSRSTIAENKMICRESCFVTIVVGLTATLMISLSGCGANRNDQEANGVPSAIEQLAVHRKQPDRLVESQTRGHLVYEHYCQICHGPEGQGNGFNSAMLTPPPRNFADEAFWKQIDQAELQKVIALGGKATGKSVLMPPWGRTINESQIQDVISFLRTVPQRAKQAAAAAEAKAEENKADDG